MVRLATTTRTIRYNVYLVVGLVMLSAVSVIGLHDLLMNGHASIVQLVVFVVSFLILAISATLSLSKPTSP